MKSEPDRGTKRYVPQCITERVTGRFRDNTPAGGLTLAPESVRARGLAVAPECVRARELP
jgi:hypothetical protein